MYVPKVLKRARLRRRFAGGLHEVKEARALCSGGEGRGAEALGLGGEVRDVAGAVRREEWVQRGPRRREALRNPHEED